MLGYCYEASPVIVPDGSVAPPVNSMIHGPSAHPGCVAPHLWLQDGSSLYDHSGEGFTLLLTAGGEAAEAEDTAREMGVPLTVIRPQEPRLRTRYAAGFALIRPDQHVAWRGDELTDFHSILRTVSGTASTRVSTPC